MSGTEQTNGARFRAQRKSARYTPNLAEGKLSDQRSSTNRTCTQTFRALLVRQTLKDCKQPALLGSLWASDFANS
jgi:hypothetical protein